MIRSVTYLSGAALVCAAPATAQPSDPAPVTQSSTQLVLLAQNFDGTKTRSLSRTAGVAEARQGEARWMMVNYGEGSVVERGDGTIAGALVVNNGETELGLAYDPAARALTGDPFLANIFNRYVRPLADRSPPSAAAWTLRFSPAEVGLAGTSTTAMTIKFTRQSVTIGGRGLTLVDYRIPGFSFADSAGVSTAQWGRGGVLIDPATGALLWSGSVHRAATQQDNSATPFRTTLTLLAVDDAGDPLADPKAIAELEPLLGAIYGASATAALPFGTSAGPPPQSPSHLAAMIDLVAISAAQNGTDAHSVALAGFLLGRTGINTAVAPTAISIGDSK